MMANKMNSGSELMVISVSVGLIHQSTAKKKKLKTKSSIEVSALLIRKSRSLSSWLK